MYDVVFCGKHSSRNQQEDTHRKRVREGANVFGTKKSGSVQVSIQNVLDTKLYVYIVKWRSECAIQTYERNLIKLLLL